MSEADPHREPGADASAEGSQEDVPSQEPSDDRALARLERARDKLEAQLERERTKHARVTSQLEREREKHGQTKQQIERHRERHAASRAALEREREKHAHTQREVERHQEERAILRRELEELHRSYHLAGVAKKLDLRELDGFAEIAGRTVAAGRTGMNYDRLFSLWQAVRAAPPDAAAIEIGSYRGGSAWFIGEAFRAHGSAPRLYVCDTFAGHAHTDPTIDVTHRNADKFKGTSAQETEAYLSDYPSLEVVVGDIAETSGRFADEAFGFVHLDVDVYPTTAFCLRFFAPRLADDALMVIDDYGFVTCPGVKQAADEFVAEFPQFRLWHLLTGQALLWRLTAPSQAAVPLAEQGRRAAS